MLIVLLSLLLLHFVILFGIFRHLPFGKAGEKYKLIILYYIHLNARKCIESAYVNTLLTMKVYIGVSFSEAECFPSCCRRYMVQLLRSFSVSCSSESFKA